MEVKSENDRLKNDDYKEQMIEIELENPEDFLKIRETLQRIGISNTRTKTLIQTCHILHKRGKYYIVHFKELLRMDGKIVDLTDEDIQRRDEIVKLLQNWGLLTITSKVREYADRVNLFVLPWRERMNGWTLTSKYKFGLARDGFERVINIVNETASEILKKEDRP